MNELIDLLNELAKKYNFADEDMARVQEAMYNLESGSDALNVNTEDVAFVVPEEYADEEAQDEA